MPNSSPSNSFSIKLKSSYLDSISVLATKTKIMKEKHYQREKRNNQTIFFSNNQTQPISKNSSSPTIKHNNQRETTKSTNPSKPKTHLGFCSDQIGPGFCWDQIRTVRKVLLELIGSDRWFSLTFSCSISFVPHRSLLGFCSDWIGPGFCWSLLKVRTEVEF